MKTAAPLKEKRKKDYRFPFNENLIGNGALKTAIRLSGNIQTMDF